MRILQVIQRYYPYVGGSEAVAREVARRLAADGHSVTVYTTDAWDLEYFWRRGKRRVASKQDVHEGVSIRRFPVRHLPISPIAYPVLRRAMVELSALPADTTPLLRWLSRFTPYVPALDRALRREPARFDLVHATNVPFDSLIVAAQEYAGRCNTPFVMTPFVHLGEPGNNAIRRYYTMRHQIEMMRRSDAVITSTGIERDHLASLGVPAERLFPIGVGVNPDEVEGGSGRRFREQHGVDGPIVFYLGTTAYDKGTIHLVEAMQRLWAGGSNATLVLAGPTMDHFMKRFQALPEVDRERCRLLGFISDQDKRDLLDAGDVFCMPSRTDSFGIVYLEAWLYSKPVVGAWAGGVPDVVSNGLDGLLVPFGDVDALARSLHALLTDQQMASRMGSAGRQKVMDQLTWDNKYKQVLTLYSRLVDEGLAMRECSGRYPNLHRAASRRN